MVTVGLAGVASAYPSLQTASAALTAQSVALRGEGRVACRPELANAQPCTPGVVGAGALLNAQPWSRGGSGCCWIGTRRVRSAWSIGALHFGIRPAMSANPVNVALSQRHPSVRLWPPANAQRREDDGEEHAVRDEANDAHRRTPLASCIARVGWCAEVQVKPACHDRVMAGGRPRTLGMSAVSAPPAGMVSIREFARRDGYSGSARAERDTNPPSPDVSGQTAAREPGRHGLARGHRRARVRVVRTGCGLFAVTWSHRLHPRLTCCQARCAASRPSSSAARRIWPCSCCAPAWPAPPSRSRSTGGSRSSAPP